MRSSDSHRLLFVHIPKTGGASVERLLDRHLDDSQGQGSRHDTLREILEMEPALTDYWIFGFVRNPWARMVSLWSMIDTAGRSAEAGDESNRRKFETYPVWRAVRGYDFETFLTRGADEVERLRRTQVDFLYTPQRQPDFIGRTENISEDINVVRDRIGLPITGSLPHRHKGSHGPYRDFYTPSLRDRVAQLFAADIEAFGYEF